MQCVIFQPPVTRQLIGDILENERASLAVLDQDASGSKDCHGPLHLLARSLPKQVGSFR